MPHMRKRMRITVKTRQDGGQWFAQVISWDRALLWEGFLCDKNDPPELVSAVAMCLYLRDTGQSKTLESRGIFLDEKKS